MYNHLLHEWVSLPAFGLQYWLLLFTGICRTRCQGNDNWKERSGHNYYTDYGSGFGCESGQALCSGEGTLALARPMIAASSLVGNYCSAWLRLRRRYVRLWATEWEWEAEVELLFNALGLWPFATLLFCLPLGMQLSMKYVWSVCALRSEGKTWLLPGRVTSVASVQITTLGARPTTIQQSA